MTKEWVPNRFALYQWHKSFGILVLVLSIFRIIWRLGHKPPALPDHMPGWQKTVSHMTHGLFYGLMIGMPLVGWAMVSASNLPVPTILFQILPLPDMPGVMESEATYKRFQWLHEAGAKLFIALILLHVGAALKHQFFDRDGVLSRMSWRRG